MVYLYIYFWSYCKVNLIIIKLIIFSGINVDIDWKQRMSIFNFKFGNHCNSTKIGRVLRQIMMTKFIFQTTELFHSQIYSFLLTANMLSQLFSFIAVMGWLFFLCFQGIRPHSHHPPQFALTLQSPNWEQCESTTDHLIDPEEMVH